MQGVTSQFKTMALSADRTPVKSAILTLVDNDIMAGNLSTVAHTIDSTNVGAAQRGTRNKVGSQHWAFADPFTTLGAGARCLPADDLYPVGAADDAGWWGSLASDASG